MKSCRLTVCGLLSAFALAPTAGAQTTTLLQLPNISVAAGMPSGGSVSAVCAGALNSTTGDGCPAAQAKLSTPMATAVDSYGNVYIADSVTKELRVIYQGGANLAAAIIASNKLASGTTLTAGYIYNLVGGGAATASGSAGGLGGSTLVSAPVSVALDGDGNVFFGDNASRIRVFFVSDASGKFSALLNKVFATTGLTPVLGYQYAIVSPSSSGYAGDGLAPGVSTNNAATYTQRGLAIDSSENVYIADSQNNAVRKITASTGLLSTYLGSTGCVEGTKASCTAGDTGNGGPIGSAETNAPYALAFDANGNLYIGEEGSGEIRAIYNGSGMLPGVSSPQTGYIYLIGGGGTAVVSGSTFLNTKFTVSSGATTNYATFAIGFDPKGNLYVGDRTGRLWKIDASSQIASIIAGTTLTSTGAQTLFSSSGSVCATGSDATTTDTLGDGCLGVQGVLGLIGNSFGFDAQGDLYFADATNSVVHELSLGNSFAATATGSSSAAQTLGFASLAAQTLGVTKFGVKGVVTSDYADAGSSTCTSGLALSSGTTCLLNVKFTPMLPGARNGFAALTNSGGTALIAAFLSGQATGAELAVDVGTTTNAGSGISARGVAVDPAGGLYVADATSSSLLQYASSTATTPAATLITGLSSPGQVALDGKGDVAVADAGNNRIAFYSTQTKSVSSITGSFSAPQGVAADGNGNLYVADTGNNRVVEVSTLGSARVLSTSVTAPTRLSFDAAGNLYILDSGNSRIVEISAATGAQTTVSASTYTPVDMALDAAGNLYVIDSASESVGVVEPGGTTYSLITALTKPVSLAVDAQGDIFVADSSAASLIGLNRQSASINFNYVGLGLSSAASSFTLTDIGSTAVQFSNSPIATGTGDTTQFATTPSSTNGCSSALNVAARCMLSSTFTPTTTGSFSEALTFPSNVGSPNATGVQLRGIGKTLLTTTTTLTLSSPASPSNLSYGTPLVLSIQLAYSTGTPTGSIQVLYNGVQQTSIPLVSGTTSYSYTFTPQAGAAAITAVYSGDSNYSSSNSTLNLTINPVTTTTALSIVRTLSAATPSITLMAQVSSAVSGIQGAVTFYNGSTTLGVVSLGASGSASLTLTALSFSNLNFSATYGGTANYAPSSGTAALTGDFGLTGSQSYSVPQGGIAYGSFTVTPYFGVSGNVRFSCSGLPENTLCRAFPQYITFAGSGDSATSVELEIFTNSVSTTAQNRRESPFRKGAPVAALALLAGALFLRRLRRLSVMPVLLMAAIAAGTLTGCSSHSTSALPVTPAGTYNVTLTATADSGATHTSTVTLTVLSE